MVTAEKQATTPTSGMTGWVMVSIQVSSPWWTQAMTSSSGTTEAVAGTTASRENRTAVISIRTIVTMVAWSSDWPCR